MKTFQESQDKENTWRNYAMFVVKTLERLDKKDVEQDEKLENCKTKLQELKSELKASQIKIGFLFAAGTFILSIAAYIIMEIIKKV